MSETRIGRQTPTTSVTVPYTETKGNEAIRLYNSTTHKAYLWQELMIYDIMAVDEDGLWVHMKFGYAVPRRKVIIIWELWGPVYGERIMHTAHRTTTSHNA